MKLAPRCQAVNFLPSGRAQPSEAPAAEPAQLPGHSRTLLQARQLLSSCKKITPQTTQGLRMLAQTPTGRELSLPDRGHVLSSVLFPLNLNTAGLL